MRAALALALVVGCGGNPDPCADFATCIELHIESATVERVDAIEVDISYGTRHATTTTQAEGGGTVELPLLFGIDIMTTTSLPVGLVAAGKLAGSVLGTGAATTTIDPDMHASLTIELAPLAECIAGSLYCGGDKLAGDPMSLYECNGGGVPLWRGRCAFGCIVNPADDDECRGGGGTCIDGGFYCGGDKLDGDPQTRYRCASGAGIDPVECSDGCVIAAPGDNDYCR